MCDAVIIIIFVQRKFCSETREKLKKQYFWPSKRQPYKMVKHTQKNLSAKSDELLECVWPFYWSDANRVKALFHILLYFFRRTPVETRTRKKINLHLTQFYQTVESYIGRMNAVFTFSANNSCCSVIIDQIFCSVRADPWPNFQLTVA